MTNDHQPPVSTEVTPLRRDDQTSYNSTQNNNSSGSVSKYSRSDTIWMLAALWCPVFLGALDGTIAATLLTPIGNYFEKANQSSYIGTSYLLSVCCFTPLYGRLADILGCKGAMLLGLSLFGSGTICCGIAPSMESLIAARAVAGMGGGGVMTVSSIAVSALIPLKQRGLYQGLANILFGLGAGLGGPVGGWVNDTLGWRWAFLLQAPVLLISFILAALKVNIPLPPEVESQPLRERLGRIDILGSLTLVGTVGCLLLGISLKSTEEMPWSHPLVLGLILSSVFWCCGFIAVEKFIAPYPVLPLNLLASRTPLAVSINNFFSSASAFAVLYNVPMYFSAVRMESAKTAGLHLLPHSVALSTGSVLAGWYMRQTGKLYWLTISSALSCILASVLAALWKENTSSLHLWLDIVFQGFGMASLITTTLIAMISSVKRSDIGVSIGVTYLFRTTGQVLGVSLSGALLQAVLATKLRQRITIPGAEEVIDQIRHSTSVIPDLVPWIRKAAVDSYADSIRIVFIAITASNILALMACIPIQENPLPGSMEEQERQYEEREESSPE